MGPDLRDYWGGGGYTFFYKEIRTPKTAPINISTNLQLKKVGSGVGKNPLVAVEMRVSATNPSSRKVYLLPNAWIVRGYKVAYRESENSESFSKLAKTTLNARDGGYLERHSSVDASSALAVGELFTDKWLNQNETVARTIVLHIPPKSVRRNRCGDLYAFRRGHEAVRVRVLDRK
jgi:hypothetical protein